MLSDAAAREYLGRMVPHCLAPPSRRATAILGDQPRAAQYAASLSLTLTLL